MSTSTLVIVAFIAGCVIATIQYVVAQLMDEWRERRRELYMSGKERDTWVVDSHDM